jgi:hypothetical protein
LEKPLHEQEGARELDDKRGARTPEGGFL